MTNFEYFKETLNKKRAEDLIVKTNRPYDLVVITDIEHVSQIIQPYYINGNVYMQIYPESFQAIVEYKGKKYVLSDYESYKLCKNNKGKKIKAEINKKIYNDGSTKYSVIKLKGDSKKK